MVQLASLAADTAHGSMVANGLNATNDKITNSTIGRTPNVSIVEHTSGKSRSWEPRNESDPKCLGTNTVIKLIVIDPFVFVFHFSSYFQSSFYSDISFYKFNKLELP